MLNIAVDYLIQAIWVTMLATQSPVQQEPFRRIEGSSLADRIAKTVKQAGTDSPGKSFWTAYTFDVRNGVAVRIDGFHNPEFQGKVESFAGTEVFYGTLNGVPASSHNVAMFALHPAGSEFVTRIEICNLDRQQRPADSNPVYFLGHAGKDESLADVRRLAESGQSQEVRARATLAIALHDDSRVSETLKNLVSKTTDSEVRSISIAWLGQLKADTDFLSKLANQESSAETQIQTIQAIARDKNGDTFPRLRSFYRPDLKPAVKMALIDAIANARDRDSVAQFLLELEQNDPSPEIKQHAIYTLRNFDSNATIEELMKRFNAEQDENFKNQIIYSLSQMRNPLIVDKLFEIARENDNPRIRRQARYWIHDRIRQRTMKEERKATDRKAEDEFEAKAERIMKERPPAEAVTIFTDIAKTDANLRTRMMAVFYLSKLDDPRVVDFYNELLSR